MILDRCQNCAQDRGAKLGQSDRVDCEPGRGVLRLFSPPVSFWTWRHIVVYWEGCEIGLRRLWFCSLFRQWGYLLLSAIIFLPRVLVWMLPESYLDWLGLVLRAFALIEINSISLLFGEHVTALEEGFDLGISRWVSFVSITWVMSFPGNSTLIQSFFNCISKVSTIPWFYLTLSSTALLG